jgi:hypothetical protein
MCRASSRTASSRASVVFPLPAQPTTTTRPGIGRVGTGRAVMPMTVRPVGQAPKTVDPVALLDRPHLCQLLRHTAAAATQTTD